MAFRKKLLPGLSVELAVAEGDYAGRYRTRVDEVGERLISVAVPYRDNQVLPLREGTIVEITYWDEISAYIFSAKIIQRIAVPVPVFVLELPDDVRKVQRRSFVRVPAFYPMTYRIVTREGLSGPVAANMIDLSGGGMRFRTKKPVENKSLLYVQLQLPNGELHTPALVARVEKSEDDKTSSVSVEFNEISERERDRIIRCVFDLQRAMRKKGLV